VYPAVLLSALVLPPPEPDVSLADLRRFPSKKVALATYGAGEAERRRLLTRVRSAPEAEQDEARRLLYETEKSMMPWEALYGAWDGGRSAWARDSVGGRPMPPARVLKNRLESLRRLRELLGCDAYRKGEVPPPLPWLQ
jgi:hypothetical protein